MNVVYFLNNFLSHERNQNFRDPHRTIFILVIFEDSDECSTTGKCCCIVGMHEFEFTIFSLHASLESPRLIVCHIVGGMCLTVFTLSWEPCFDVRTLGIWFSDIIGTLLKFSIRDLELLHEILLNTREEEMFFM